MPNTSKQYDKIINTCREIFEKKMKDYGCSWRILRLPSITDQIFIKAQRLRVVQDNKNQKVDESPEAGFIAIVNYSAMALIQTEKGIASLPDLDDKAALKLYNQKIAETKALMENKNHDYGEAWRDMRIGSLTDLILQKLLRIKQIEDNQGQTLVSEGVDGNYQDILNYAVFALILLSE